MSTRPRRYTLFVVTLSLGAALLAVRPTVEAQDTAGQSRGPSDKDLQRSYRIDHYTEVAESGPERGENIYYHKCWVCHNQYQKYAPHLTDVFKDPTLLDDATVLGTIKDGNAGMPSFRTTLKDADIADLLSYIRSGKCCFEGMDLPDNPQYRASAQKWSVSNKLAGGPKGAVQAGGAPVEGVMVQLIAPNGVRTTVYSNDEGNYEFPTMQSGSYTLRIATPVEFKPYERDSVQINGAAKLDDIVLEKISDSRGAVPATPEVESQLTGAELLWNLPGTAKEKDVFHGTCGEGCHSFQQILKNRYDERSWRVLVTRMLHHGGGPLFNTQQVSPKTVAEEDDVVVKWLAKVRGPDSQDGMMVPFPRPTGAATHVVVTEYEMPHVFLSIHDVYGDSKGNIWYTSHMTRFMGKLDPRTGIVTDYPIPVTPGALPGTHHVVVDKNDLVWLSEGWSRKYTRFDQKTEQFKDVPYDGNVQGNFALAPDGSIWNVGAGAAQKIDTETGKVVAKFPFTGPGSYESLVSQDGKYWAGGSNVGPYGNTAELLDIRTGQMLNLSTGIHPSAGKRGGFDPFGNAWFSGFNGTFVEIDTKAKRIREFRPPSPPLPYTDFYAATADKNGEVWAGEIHGRGFLRFNPRTGRWVEYMLPEPYAHTREIWVDNSTSPVTVWYPDFSLGRIVRIQPLD